MFFFGRLRKLKVKGHPKGGFRFCAICLPPPPPPIPMHLSTFSPLARRLGSGKVRKMCFAQSDVFAKLHQQSSTILTCKFHTNHMRQETFMLPLSSHFVVPLSCKLFDYFLIIYSFRLHPF